MLGYLFSSHHRDLRFHRSGVRECELGLYQELFWAYGQVTGPFWKAGVSQTSAQVLSCGEFSMGEDAFFEAWL